ncbi:MAG: box helicase [Verrucomicrobiales bacterium]|nr:box helicase [Verrucomicrobiales bacterium]
MDIVCAGENLTLLPERALLWPRRRTLFVADLHFGKSAAFRAAGIPMPEGCTSDDLKRLDRLMELYSINTLIILGDFFHAASGCSEPIMSQIETWCGRHSKVSKILVPGNHDKKSSPPPACWNFQIQHEPFLLDPFAGCHSPRRHVGHYVLAGHIHPGFALQERYGRGIRLPCFVFGKYGAILPAFGGFTGLHPVDLVPGDSVYLVGDGKVFALPEFKATRKTRQLK